MRRGGVSKSLESNPSGAARSLPSHEERPRSKTHQNEHHSTLEPPSHLSPASQAWWRGVLQGWRLEEHHVRVLTLAAEAYDRAQQAQELLRKDGLVIEGREGGIRPHPAVAIRRDSEISFARLLRELDLDVDPPTSGRSAPPSLRSIRR